MKLLILDLEWDTIFSSRHDRFVSEIIEFGGILLDENLCEIDSRKLLVRSQLAKKLSGRFKKLTHITNDEMWGGAPFTEALSDFSEFAKEADAILTWSNTDLFVLLDNCRLFTEYNFIPFLQAYLDLQLYIQKFIGTNGNNQIALSAAAEALKLNIAEYDLHRATDDARLCAELLRLTFDESKIREQIIPADCTEFYDKLLFKNHFIKDLTSSDIDRKQLRFYCDCGRRLIHKTLWKNKNQGFGAELYCKHCEIDFLGYVTFKQTYDEIVVKRRLRIKPEEVEEVEEPAEN